MQDKVLRVRKTEIGKTVDFEDLLEKAKLDLEFQLMIAGELLGPLIIDDKTEIVILDKNKHLEIMDLINKKRSGITLLIIHVVIFIIPER